MLGENEKKLGWWGTPLSTYCWNDWPYKLSNLSRSLTRHPSTFSHNLTRPVNQYSNLLVILLLRSRNGSSCWICGTEIESPDSFFPASLSSSTIKPFFRSNAITLHFYAVFIFYGLLHATGNIAKITGLDHCRWWKWILQAKKAQGRHKRDVEMTASGIEALFQTRRRRPFFLCKPTRVSNISLQNLCSSNCVWIIAEIQRNGERERERRQWSGKMFLRFLPKV